jgi:phage virion morphogenesis protein
MMTIDMAVAIAEMDGILLRLHDTAPALRHIGERAVATVQGEIMRGKSSPEGEAWAPWQPMTVRERTMKGNTAQGLLWDTGALLHSIRAEESPNQVAIGSDEDYALELQFGRNDFPRMEARPFLGWSADELDQASFIVASYIEAGVLA